MITKLITLTALVVFSFTSVKAQDKTCETPLEDSLLELNSITKCSIENNSDEKNSKKAPKINIQVSTKRRRVVRKRTVATGIASSDASHKIENIKEKASLVGSLDLSNEKTLENLPFGLVDQIPLFNECERSPISEQEKCFKKEISDHLRENFNYPESAYRNSIQGRVYTQFIIDETGKVADLKIRGPYKGLLLEKEAERIIKKLPEFKPGKHNGRKVKVKYNIPLNFKIPGRQPSNVKKVIKKVDFNAVDVIDFATVEQIPTFKICSNENDLGSDCFNREIINYVNQNFVYPQEAIIYQVQGKIITSFIIDKNGDIANIKTEGPDGTEILQRASKKLLQNLPPFVPATHQEERVNVKHSYPLNFILDIK